MLKYYETDSDGFITVTSDYGVVTEDGMTGEQFDFPDDFDFERQSFYRITDGQLVQDTERLDAAVREQLASDIRDKRNALLTKCDWTQSPDTPLTADEQAQWAHYRQALRDIPQQPGFPFEVDFPARP